MATTAIAKVQHDDRRTRVTRWDFDPGTSTGTHVHRYDYVVVPLTDGQLTVLAEDGTFSESHLRAGEPYVRPAGVAHEVINSGEAWLAFVEIELKETALQHPEPGAP